MATAAWAEDTLAGLANSGTTLADGTALLAGQISFAADGPAFALPAADGDPPEFAALAGEYRPPLPRSWPPVPLPSRLGFCTQTPGPRFARRSRLTRFWGLDVSA